MKLRYYLRGLGIGMLVAALVLIISGNANAKMSDEAVKRRAAELGMVERDTSVLGDVGTENGEQSEDDDAQESGDEAADGAQDDAAGAVQEKEDTSVTGAGDEAEAVTDEQESGAAADGQENKETSVAEKELAEEIEERAEEVADRAEEVAESAPAGRSVTLEVVRGDSSISVARKAQEAGLVASAADFDVFLCRNGYDKRISIGKYEITEGMSEKEIADIITKSVG